MTNIFDLTAVKALVDREKPDALLVVDTNIIIREPDFKKWITGLDKPLFLITNNINLELEMIKKKQPRGSQEGVNINRAIVSLTSLYSKGNPCDGIALESVGWFISTPIPEESIIEEALTRWKSIYEAFHKKDTLLALLTKECKEVIQDVSTLMVTGDRTLCNMVKGNGFPAYFMDVEHMNFAGIKESLPVPETLPTSIEPVDWDKVLENINESTEKSLVEVEMVLLSKRYLDGWALECKSEDGDPKRSLNYNYHKVILFEGTGMVHLPTNEACNFNWKALHSGGAIEIPLKSGKYPDLLHDEDWRDIYVKFWGGGGEATDSLCQSLKKEILSKITVPAFDYVFPPCDGNGTFRDGFPKLWDTTSLMSEFFEEDIDFKLMGDCSGLDDDPDKFYEKCENEQEKHWPFFAWWIEVFGRLNSDEQREHLSHLILSCAAGCWNVGQSTKFKIMNTRKDDITKNYSGSPTWERIRKDTIERMSNESMQEAPPHVINIKDFLRSDISKENDEEDETE